MKGFIHGFKHYFDVSGRDSRSLYWGFIISTNLIGLLFFVVLAYLLCRSFIPAVLGSIEEAADGSFYKISGDVPSCMSAFIADHILFLVIMLMGMLWWVGCLIPTLTATVRRLRDAGKSPWWVLAPVFSLSGIPYVSQIALCLCIVVIVLCCFDTARTSSPQDLPPTPQE